MSRFTTLVAVVALVGCESNLIANEPLPHVDDGLFGDAGKKRNDAGKPKPSDEEEPNTDDEEPTDEEPTDDDAPPEGEVDAGKEPGGDDAAQTETDAGSEEPMESVIKGSGIEAKCTSYGTAKNGMCAGYYCGITIEQLTAEYKPGNKCDTTPEKICDGQLTRDVARCAREVRSNPINQVLGEEAMRELVQECVYKVPTHQNTTEECLSCFLDAAQCASDNCLTQCLTGDSATCDKCRLDNECNQPVPGCAGFPTPF